MLESTSEFLQSDAGDAVKICELCPRRCHLAEGASGFCRVRINRNAVIQAKHKGLVSALALDPIEKKALYHFYPGRLIFSVGLFGCNMRCPFCQNADISMQSGELSSPDDLAGCNRTAQELIAQAKAYLRSGNVGIAFTYNEPLLAYEYLRETFELAQASRLETVLVTNANFQPAVIRAIAPLTSAWNIDLKAFTTQAYQRLGGDLASVKEAIQIVAASCHLEVTTLVVPSLNDSMEELDDLARWLAQVNPEIPLHLSRFFPRYKETDKKATDIDLLQRMQKQALLHLRYVYLGNC